MANSLINNSGKTDYRLIRYYNRGLKASEILLNYKHAISYTKTDTNSLYQEIVERDNNFNIAKIFFIKNKNKSEMSINKDGIFNVNFNQLHTIKKKKPDAGDEAGLFYSKTSAINCTAFLVYND